MICPQRVCSSDGYVDEHSEMRSLWRVISGEYLRAIQLIPVTFYFKIDVRGGAEGLLSRRDFWFWGCKKPRPSSAHHVQGKIGSEPHSSVPPFSFYNSSFSDPSPLWYCFAHAPISSHSQLCVRLRSFTSATTYCNLSPPRKILSTLLSRPDNISKCRKSLLWRMWPPSTRHLFRQSLEYCKSVRLFGEQHNRVLLALSLNPQRARQRMRIRNPRIATSRENRQTFSFLPSSKQFFELCDDKKWYTTFQPSPITYLIAHTVEANNRSVVTTTCGQIRIDPASEEKRQPNMHYTHTSCQCSKEICHPQTIDPEVATAFSTPEETWHT